MAPVGVSVLGATGSVGKQALDVIAAFPEHFRVVGLAAHRNAADMAELVRVHRPQVAVMVDPGAADLLQQRLGGADVQVASGESAMVQLAAGADSEVVVASVAGSGGLESVAAAVDAGKRVALANKESLVMAGELLMERAASRGAELLPVDSEHAAAHQLIHAAGADCVRKVILTASGGPFVGRPAAELARVTPEEALAHPNWSMGPKISIDSATMMNKGFEVIEAHWLFGLPPERIEVVVHTESLVHALVETTDGTLLAHTAVPDMRGPIAYALAYPRQLDLPARLQDFARMDLARTGTLSFQPADPDAYPALALCRRALEAGGGLPAALALADEVVVEAFLEGRIGFPQMVAVLEQVVARTEPVRVGSIRDVQAAGRRGARRARALIEEIRGG